MGDDERAFIQSLAQGTTDTKASPAANTRAQVFVEVSGGIAEVTVTHGDVDVISIDWDNVEDGDSEYIGNLIEEAREIADEVVRDLAVDKLERWKEMRKADEKWSEEQAVTREREERERAASLLGIEEGSPAWLYYTKESPEEEG